MATAFRCPPSLYVVPSSRPLQFQSPNSFFSPSPSPSPYPLLRRWPPPLAPTVAFARRKKSAASTTTAPHKSEKLMQAEEGADVDDDDPFEALFSQLEEDLKNDKDLSDGDTSDEIGEEDMARLEKELGEVVGDVDIEDSSGSLRSDLDDLDSDSEEEIERIPELKTWQLQRLAAALKVGRRKIGIKSLAGELGLDRAVVLELLREPPPKLLMMSASLPDKIVGSPVAMESKQVEPPPAPEVPEVKPEPKKKLPVHEMREIWLKQKRLKKWQVGTLEKVYRRMRRPTDSMVSSIIYVTKLPRKTIIKWFEARRAQDGVPERRVPYYRANANISGG